MRTAGDHKIRTGWSARHSGRGMLDLSRCASEQWRPKAVARRRGCRKSALQHFGELRISAIHACTAPRLSTVPACIRDPGESPHSLAIPIHLGRCGLFLTSVTKPLALILRLIMKAMLRRRSSASGCWGFIYPPLPRNSRPQSHSMHAEQRLRCLRYNELAPSRPGPWHCNLGP
jgi:hypothetical protein